LDTNIETDVGWTKKVDYFKKRPWELLYFVVPVSGTPPPQQQGSESDIDLVEDSKGNADHDGSTD
jgi:hypothetical protein